MVAESTNLLLFIMYRSNKIEIIGEIYLYCCATTGNLTVIVAFFASSDIIDIAI